ncbi:MAG TPA: choice-of-anchor Q domain-containing protein [Bacteroidales bacterium]|nr:choice-of-anchor Q domain-containing protein [Bacteroidales bacterium]
MKKVILLFMATLCLFAGLRAQIIHVPGDYPTIQQAIDSAQNHDTVLVEPGTYFENLFIYDKNITLGSEFIMTGDTSLISQTIIDGSSMLNVITINTVDTAVISGFKITHGYGDQVGGILCNGNARFDHLEICDNWAWGVFWGHGYSPAYGGGINANGNVQLDHVKITRNTADCDEYPGGGGGGIVSWGNLRITNSVIADNNAMCSGEGGGILNFGQIYLSNVTLTGNRSGRGGAIKFGTGSIVTFDPSARCNIYDNYGGQGSELYSDTLVLAVLDTFMVMNPTGFHANPPSNFTFDILHGKYQPVDADLFVSPAGDNGNDGLTAGTPLKTMSHGLAVIRADSLHHHTLHLSAGTYSGSLNGETFPVYLPDYVDVSGVSETQTILDAGPARYGFYFSDSHANRVSGMTLLGSGSGIWCVGSSPEISHLRLTGHFGSPGGGIMCANSTPLLHHLLIDDNTADLGAGLYCSNSAVTLEDVTFTYDSLTYSGGYSPLHTGGAIYCESSTLTLDSVYMHDNYAYDDGGGIFCKSSDITLQHTRIAENRANRGGGISISNSQLTFDTAHTCSIYNNFAYTGRDLFTDKSVDVVVDTFSVLNPTSLFASPLNKFTFDILHGYIMQENADLWVSPAGDNSNDGLSEATPLKNADMALLKVRADSLHPHTIHLLPGLYSPDSTGEAYPLIVPDYVNLSGTDTAEVKLDAGSHFDAIRIEGNSSNRISGMTLTNTASWGNGTGGIDIKHSRVVVDSVRITGWGDNSSGIYCDSSALTLQNSGIINNARTGITLINSSGSVENSLVSGNRGSGVNCTGSDFSIANTQITGNINNYYSGGGIACIGSVLALNNVVVEKDSAEGGAGIFCSNSTISMTGGRIGDNCVSDYYAESGAGMHSEGSNLFLSDVVFKGNKILYGQGGGMYLNNTRVKATQVSVDSNFANFGGGISVINSDSITGYMSITNNHASKNGGGIYCDSDVKSIRDMLIENNTGQLGGGIYCNYTDPELVNLVLNDNMEGQFYCKSSAPYLKNVTITSTINAAPYYGLYSYQSNPVLVNSIVSVKGDYQIRFLSFSFMPDTILISYSDILGGLAAVYSNYPDRVHWLEGNIDSNPLFDSTGAIPYALLKGSPCVDAGTSDTTGLNLPSTDLGGNPRIFNERIDMGAYEWNNLGSEELGGARQELRVSIRPNPAMDHVIISFRLDQPTQVTLTVLNSLGQVVAQPVNRVLREGEQEVYWNTGSLPAGIYYVQLQSGGRTASGKVVVSK